MGIPEQPKDEVVAEAPGHLNRLGRDMAPSSGQGLARRQRQPNATERFVADESANLAHLGPWCRALAAASYSPR